MPSQQYDVDLHMADFETDRLFLLEFLVDSVQICKTKSLVGELSDPKNWLRGQTCVNFQFLNFPPFEIDEKHFSPCNNSDEEATFKSGKSCLFAMPKDFTCLCSNGFNIRVEVFRKMQTDILPPKIVVGELQVPITPMYKELLCCPCDPNAPESRTLKDTFALRTVGGCSQVGDVTVFVRLSSFGKMIITQFQMNDEKSFLFQGAEDAAVYQCKKMEVGEKECGCISLVDPEEQQRRKCSANEQQMMYNNYPQNNMMFPPQPPPPMYYPPMYEPNAMQMPMQAPSPCKGYEEIGAELNGHALNIKVPKKKKKDSCCEGSTAMEGAYSNCCGPSSRMCPPPQSPYPGGYPGQHMYQNNFMPQQSYPPNMGMMMPGQGYGGMSMSHPLGTVAMENNAITYSMPQKCGMSGAQRPGEGKPTMRYKMSECDAKCSPAGCGECCKVIKIEPCEEPPKGCGKNAKKADDGKDVFVLKIGKQCEGNERKSKLELELKTPKKEIPGQFNTTSHDTQYLATDFAEAEGEGKPKAGKGKAAGGKKGKKGKK